jgi:hypothetical protein
MHVENEMCESARNNIAHHGLMQVAVLSVQLPIGGAVG